MSLERALAFLIFAVVAAITPGPSNVMLTATGAAAGVRGGLPCLFGVAAGMGALMLATSLGLGQVALGHPLALKVMNWGGAAFLLWLAWKIASAGSGSSTEERKRVGFGEAAAFQWINPKSWLVGISAAGTYMQAEAGGALGQALGFALLFMAAALPSGLVWLALGASLHRWLGEGRRARLFNLAMGLALAASVAMILA